MDYLAPLSHDPDYTELPQEQRERVYRLLLAISHVPEDASVTKPGGVLDILSASTGMARDTVQRLSADEQQRWIDVAKHLSKIITEA